jgi:hypothetical protein
MESDDVIKYISEQEATDVSYTQIGDSKHDTLIVSFSSNIHYGFERKKSLVNLRKEFPTFDILYMRNKDGWYVEKLNGIGNNINDTISFFNELFASYENVVLTGISMGGYASILFGSLCNATSVVAVNPQTNLSEMCFQMKTRKKPRFFESLKNIENLIINDAEVKKYREISDYINETTKYYVYSEGDSLYDTWSKKLRVLEKILHGDYHIEKLLKYPNISYKQLPIVKNLPFISEHLKKLILTP